MLWNDEISLEVVNFSSHHLHTKIKGSLRVWWFFLMVDGIPDTSKRVSSWELVPRIYQGDGGQWCIIGDFNEIITQDEKIGGRPRPQKQMEQFRSMLESNGLIDTKWKNQKFTWSNRHHNETFAKERLDRMVANQKWLNEFGLSRVEVLASSRSDHLPIMLSIGEQLTGMQLESGFLGLKLNGP